MRHEKPTAQRTNQERTPFICPLWNPIHLRFNSKQGPLLSSLSVHNLDVLSICTIMYGVRTFTFFLWICSVVSRRNSNPELLKYIIELRSRGDVLIILGIKPGSQEWEGKILKHSWDSFILINYSEEGVWTEELGGDSINKPMCPVLVNILQ